MTSDFWNSPTYRVIGAMKTQGNRPGVIAQWVALAHQWALDNRGPEAEAIRAWLPHFHLRPFYTATELAPMWPALIVALGLSQRPPRFSPGRLSMQLRHGGLPFLQRDDGTEWFPNPTDGNLSRYFIVERIHYWRKRRLSVEEFRSCL